MQNVKMAKEQNVKFFWQTFFTPNIFSLQNNVAMLQGRSQGEGDPPETEPIVVKNSVISEGSIISNKFSKIKIKIQFFYRSFMKNFQNFLEISQPFAFFVQTPRKITSVNFLKNMLKQWIFSNFLKNLFKIFEKCPPPRKNPGYAHAMLDENKDVNQFCFIAVETILTMFKHEIVSFVTYPRAPREGGGEVIPLQRSKIFLKKIRFFQGCKNAEGPW